MSFISPKKTRNKLKLQNEKLFLHFLWTGGALAGTKESNLRLCYVMLCLLCYVMLCYVMLCYVMLCYVMLSYVMLCYGMLCYERLG